MIYTISSSAPGGTDYQSAQAEDAAGIERAIGEIRRTPGGHVNGVRVTDEHGQRVQVCYRHSATGRRIEPLDGSECGAPPL